MGGLSSIFGVITQLGTAIGSAIGGAIGGGLNEFANQFSKPLTSGDKEPEDGGELSDEATQININGGQDACPQRVNTIMAGFGSSGC